VYADDLLRPWRDAVVASLPPIDSFDAHTHTGSNDPDGFRCSPEELLEALGQIGARAAVFTMHEPDGYPPANDRILEEARAAGGVLVPFCRLNPHVGGAEAAREAERCLDAGARGIKLHPRAEGFGLDEPEVRRVFEIANERRLPVIIHAGRGIPALGANTVEFARALPDARIILAHCGISDLGWIWRDAQELPNIYFDTSWWSPADVMTLCALVPPGQVLFASDTPYGTPVAHSIFLIRCALEVGLSQEQVRGIMGGQLERLLEGDDPLDLGPALGRRELAVDLLLRRVETFLTTAIGRLFSDGDATETLALARLACDVRRDDPYAELCASIVRLLDIYGRVADPPPRGPASRGVHLITTAFCLAATPSLGAPARN
jgi:predicted TIM-barrel fold metal-dependent hydrolase